MSNQTEYSFTFLKIFHNYSIISFGILFEIIILASNIYVLVILLIDSFKPVKKKFEAIIHKDKPVTKRTTTNSSELKDDEPILSKQVTEVVVARTSATNAFLISLCVSDLLIGTLVLPIFIFTKSNQTFWTVELCRIFRFFKIFSILSNSLSNVAIALERLRLVVFKAKYSFPLIIFNILAFYAFAFGLSFIEIQGSRLVRQVNSTEVLLFGEEVRCTHSNDKDIFERVVYASIYLFFVSVLPLFCIIIFYLLILHTLDKIAKKTQGNNKSTVTGTKVEVTSKKQKLRSSFYQIVFVMLCSHFPHGVLSLLEYVIDSNNDPVLFFIIDITFVITTSHAFFILYPYKYLYPKKLLPKKIIPITKT